MFLVLIKSEITVAIGEPLTSILCAGKKPGFFHLGLLAIALGHHACPHPAGRAKCMGIQILYEECKDQAWEQCLSLPVTFLWLELNHAVISNWTRNREVTFSGKRNKQFEDQQTSHCHSTLVCSSTSVWPDLALGMKTEILETLVLVAQKQFLFTSALCIYNQ